MFAMRGIAVTFSVFVMVYGIVSLAVGCTWRRIRSRARHLPVGRLADLLFMLRISPLAIATVTTAAFTVPSFLLLEPRSIEEPLGAIPVVLALCGAILAVSGLLNAVLAIRRASRTISDWTSSAEPVQSAVPVPVLRIGRAVPAMTAAGIVRPRILLSGSAEFVLNGNELRTALNHEIAHIRRRDNFKKLLVHFVAFPGLRGLESAWLEATEMAADDAAVSSTADALDLAAALIKLSTLRAVEPSPDLTAALVHGHANSINARVERLISWSGNCRRSQNFSAWRGVGAAIATIVLFAITYGSLLARVHTATEWLVR